LAYNILWHAQAFNDLRSLDRTTSGKIIERVKNHLSLDPVKLGKPLKGVLKGLHRYRWGKYRIIYVIDSAENRISVLHVGNRKDVYR
jgi:mRNA interferase RelE/StbE